MALAPPSVRPAPSCGRPTPSRDRRPRRRVVRALAGLGLLLVLAVAATWSTTPGVADADQRVAARLAVLGGEPLAGDVRRASPPR